jgi:hypothetical protein
VRLVPTTPVGLTPEQMAAKRKAAFGQYRQAFEGFDIDLEALKIDRSDPDERFKRKFSADT